MLGFTFSSKLDWDSYVISVAKTAAKKIRVLIYSMKFLSPDVVLYFYESTIRPCMEYCYHVWDGAPSSYLLPLLNLCFTVESLNIFYRYCFGSCSSELAQLVPLPYSQGRSTRYSDKLHDFSVTIPRCY